MPRKRRGQPVQVASGQPYGQRQQLEEAQSAVPVAGDPIEAARQMQVPMGTLQQPSERPEEPLTAGLPTGAGPGPEVLGNAPKAPEYDPDMILLAPYLPMLEQLASRPGTSQATRNIVRMLRSAVPPEFSFEDLLDQVGDEG